MSGLIVTLDHARRASTGRRVLCAPGIRPWFARYGLDYRRFIEHGLPAEDLEKTNDAFALRAVAIARAEAEEARETYRG